MIPPGSSYGEPALSKTSDAHADALPTGPRDMRVIREQRPRGTDQSGKFSVLWTSFVCRSPPTCHISQDSRPASETRESPQPPLYLSREYEYPLHAGRERAISPLQFIAPQTSSISMLVRFYFVLAVASARMIDIAFPESSALITTVSFFTQLRSSTPQSYLRCCLIIAQPSNAS